MDPVQSTSSPCRRRHRREPSLARPLPTASLSIGSYRPVHVIPAINLTSTQSTTRVIDGMKTFPRAVPRSRMVTIRRLASSVRRVRKVRGPASGSPLRVARTFTCSLLICCEAPC
jgi:hypothetical protein